MAFLSSRTRKRCCERSESFRSACVPNLTSVLQFLFVRKADFLQNQLDCSYTRGMLRGSLKRDEKETKHMKLSTELLLANLVILGALWYTALHGQLAITFILFALMIAIRVWGIFALRKERAEERAVVKARIRAIIDRKFKGAP